MTSLTILTIAYGASDLLDLCVRSILAHTHPTPQILICDNKGEANIKHPQVEIIRNKPSLSGGSLQHGESINRLLPHVKTEWVAIIESDVVVLEGWNNIGNHDSILAQKGNGLYHICLALFKTDLVRGIDFRAGRNDKDRISNRSYDAKYDVGWRLSKVKFNARFMDFVDCKEGKGQYWGPEFQSDEFWLGGKCIAGHLGRGSNIKGKRLRKGFKSPAQQKERWKKIAEELIK